MKALSLGPIVMRLTSLRGMSSDSLVDEGPPHTPGFSMAIVIFVATPLGARVVNATLGYLGSGLISVGELLGPSFDVWRVGDATVEEASLPLECIVLSAKP